MSKTITIINGHPDGSPERLCHALAQAYADGASSAGHNVHRLDIANMEFPILRSAEDHKNGTPVESIKAAQNAIVGCDHLVIIYPLWLGAVPALLKAFLEQLFRPGFSYVMKSNGLPEKLMKGRSVRIIITMGMPAFAYRWYFCAHSLKALKRNVLKFCGFGPIRDTIFGMVEAVSDKKREKWLDDVTIMGRHAK